MRFAVFFANRLKLRFKRRKSVGKGGQQIFKLREKLKRDKHSRTRDSRNNQRHNDGGADRTADFQPPLQKPNHSLAESRNQKRGGKRRKKPQKKRKQEQRKSCSRSIYQIFNRFFARHGNRSFRGLPKRPRGSSSQKLIHEHIAVFGYNPRFACFCLGICDSLRFCAIAALIYYIRHRVGGMRSACKRCRVVGHYEH